MSLPFRPPQAAAVPEPSPTPPSSPAPWTAPPPSAPLPTPAAETAIAAARPATASTFVPLLLLAIVLLASFVFQATQLRGERETLDAMRATQDRSVQDSRKVRDALDAIARATMQLADSGNPNARVIVDELKRRGVTIQPNATGAAPSVPSKP